MKIYIMPPEFPTNADIQRSFDSHAKHDEKFQEETREADKLISQTLLRIEESLKDIHGRVGGIENKLDPDHKDYILTEVENKMEPLIEIYQGFVFGRKAVLWTAGIVGGVSLIVGSVIATIRFIK